MLLKGFFKGTSAEQDRRFSDKEVKLLKSMKFPPEFDKKVGAVCEILLNENQHNFLHLGGYAQSELTGHSTMDCQKGG